MKKLISFILVWTIMIPLCLFPVSSAMADDNELIVTTDDTELVTRIGNFRSSTSLPGPDGTAVTHYFTDNKDNYVRYSAVRVGYQEVFVYILHFGKTATDVQTTVTYNGGKDTKVIHMDYTSVPQCSKTTDANVKLGTWVSIGTYYFIGDPITESIKIQMGPNSEPDCTFRTYAVKFVANYTGQTITTDHTDFVNMGGTWDTNSDLNGPDGQNITHYFTANKDSWIKYHARALWPGLYETYLYVMNDGTAATDVMVTVSNCEGVTTRNIDFSTSEPYTNTGTWVSIGSFKFNGGTCEEYVKLQLGPEASGILRTYAVKFVICYPETVIISARDEACIRSGEPEKMWPTSTLIGPSGEQEIHYFTNNKEDFAIYSAEALHEGYYNIYIYAINIHDSTATDVEISVIHDGNISISNLDYKSVKPYSHTSGGVWVCIGKYYFRGGSADEYIKLQLGSDSQEGAALRISSVKFEPSSKLDDEDIIIRAGEVGLDPGDKWFISSSLILDDGITPVRYQKKAGSSYKFSAQSLIAGLYDVYYYRVRSSIDTPNFVDDNKVRMYVVHNGKTQVLDVDCNVGGDGWVRIGSYDFAGNSPDEYVKLERLHRTDPTIATYATAIKFIPVEKFEMNKTMELYALPDTVWTTRTGAWLVAGSSLPGPDGVTKTSYVAENQGPGAALTFIPPMLDTGLYDVYVYKYVHTEKNDPDLLVRVEHNGKTSDYHLDCTVGKSEYVYIGTYDFAGNGANETISFIRTAEMNAGIISRAVSIKLVGPKIAPDTVNNVVGRDIRLNYHEHADYNVSGITINGSSISNYTLDETGIIIDGSIFTTAGDYEIVITADGYDDITITQKISAIPNDIILEASSAELIGEWNAETILTGYNGETTSFYSNDTEASARWNLDLSVSGKYGVYFYNLTDLSNAEQAIVTVNSNNTISKKIIDTKNDLTGWAYIGDYYFNAEYNKSVSLSQIGVGGRIRADAIKLVYIPDTDLLIEKMTLANYADTVIDLSSSIEKLRVESKIYNDSSTAMTVPKLYAAIYDSNRTLKDVIIIEALHDIIQAGNNTVYLADIANATFNEGDYLSLYMWHDNLAPIATQYINIYVN